MIRYGLFGVFPDAINCTGCVACFLPFLRPVLELTAGGVASGSCERDGVGRCLGTWRHVLGRVVGI
jgi:hypothetical protein